ncbi:MAG: SMC-Scp complex subunit ScpB [Clostridiales bacterium]|nr:SMC-Scp complex subunit ScpB [Clostridiales bacterium]
MLNDRLCGIIESILFVYGEAIDIETLANALGHEVKTVHSALNDLEQELQAAHRGLSIKRFANMVQLVSKADYATYVERVLQPVQRQSLSQSALETLVIVAYLQPVTRQEVEAIRGVKCDYSLQSLSQKGLIADVGRKETLGRPILYATTAQFLSHFGIQSLDELPELPADFPGEEGIQLKMELQPQEKTAVSRR